MIGEEPLRLAVPAAHAGDSPQTIELEQIMFNIINEYLKPHSTLSTGKAGSCLEALMPENRPAWLHQEHEHAGYWMRQVFDFFWKIAKQIPYNHSGQDKLMNLLKSLPHVHTVQTVLTDSVEHTPAWTELANWDDESEIHWALKRPDKKHKPDKETCEQYVNASAFAARFFKTVLAPALYVHSPTRRLGRRLAFETIEKAVGRYIVDPDKLSCHFIAAAQWILVAADWLWGELRWGRVQCSEVAEAERKHIAFAPDFAPDKWVR